MPDALCYIASLVKISNKFDHMSVGYIKEPPGSSLKLYLLKTIEISKLENYKTTRKCHKIKEELDFNI